MGYPVRRAQDDRQMAAALRESRHRSPLGARNELTRSHKLGQKLVVSRAVPPAAPSPLSDRAYQSPR